MEFMWQPATESCNTEAWKYIQMKQISQEHHLKDTAEYQLNK